MILLRSAGSLTPKRKGDYWREMFDAAASRHFHETGGTEFLRHFGYEQSADWWKDY